MKNSNRFHGLKYGIHQFKATNILEKKQHVFIINLLNKRIIQLKNTVSTVQ
jgi:hypothetical protein